MIGPLKTPQGSEALLWLLFALIAFCARSLQYMRRQRRALAGKTKKFLINRLQKETKEIIIKRRKCKTKSVEKQGWKTTVLKKIGSFQQAIGRSKMNAYPYLQKERRNGKERRKSRVPVGITFEYFDRRQADSTLYTDSERRSGMDRRGKVWDRRKPKLFCYG